MICKNCGTLYAHQTALPGNGWIELLLLVFLLPVGLLYTVWRRTQRRPACSSCGSTDLLGLQTPAGRALANQHYPAGLPALPAAPTRPPAASLRSLGRLALGIAAGVVLLVLGLPLIA